MNVEIFGHVCIDRNITESGDLFIGAGSPAIFIDKVYRQLPDVKTRVLASYGPDFVPLISGTNIVPMLPNTRSTLIYENVTENGSRVQRAFNRDEALPVKIKGLVSKGLELADIVFIAPILPNYSADVYYEVAKRTPGALKVLLPQGHFREFNDDNEVIFRKFEEADNVLPKVDLLVLSEQDYPDIAYISREWARNHGLVSVVTMGEEGAVAFDSRGQEYRLPTELVAEEEIVDSVGSGDIFAAGFAYRYKQTGNINEAGRFANALARQCLYYSADNLQIDTDSLIATI